MPSFSKPRIEKKKLLLLLDRLTPDGWQLLRMLMARLSIERTDWVHTDCDPEGRQLGGKKEHRLEMLDTKAIYARIDLHQPCVVVGMGRLSCEFLTGASLISRRAGTCWFNDILDEVWICYSPDAALRDPKETVGIYGVLAKAAEKAGIETRFNPEAKMSSWDKYV